MDCIGVHKARVVWAVAVVDDAAAAVGDCDCVDGGVVDADTEADGVGRELVQMPEPVLDTTCTWVEVESCSMFVDWANTAGIDPRAWLLFLPDSCHPIG